MRKIWILVIAVIAFLVAYALYDPLTDAVNGAVFAAGGATATALSGFWDTITASPIYQSYHMLIWFVGGIVFLYAFQRLLRPRMPGFKKKVVDAYKPMGPPAAPVVSSYTPTAPATSTAQTVVAPATTNPVEPEKETATAS